jgi:hypothetical protein
MKKIYKQPSVEATQLQLSTIVLAGSPGATELHNSEQGTDGLGDEFIIGG